MPKDNQNEQPETPVLSRSEEFLRAVEGKTNDAVHRRILRACRSTNPSSSMEAELKKVIEEIFDET